MKYDQCSFYFGSLRVFHFRKKNGFDVPVSNGVKIWFVHIFFDKFFMGNNFKMGKP